jgi:hypothetical protein
MKRPKTGMTRKSAKVDEAALHGVCRSVVMASLAADPRLMAAFAEMDAGEPAELVEARLLSTLAALGLGWPWLPTELRLARRAWVYAGGAPGWYAARARGIVAESREAASLAATPALPPLPAFGPNMDESEALLVLDAWYHGARRAISAVAINRRPGRRASPSTIDAIRGYAGWLVRRRLRGETIESIAQSGLEDASSAIPADRGSWIRDGITRVDALLATEPVGTLLALGESKDPGIAGHALPYASDVPGGTMTP